MCNSIMNKRIITLIQLGNRGYLCFLKWFFLCIRQQLVYFVVIVNYRSFRWQSGSAVSHHSNNVLGSNFKKCWKTVQPSMTDYYTDFTWNASIDVKIECIFKDTCNILWPNSRWLLREESQSETKWWPVAFEQLSTIPGTDLEWREKN